MRDKKGRFVKGHTTWCKDKHLSKEHKKKISKSNKGNPAHRYWLGKKRSKEDREKMSESHKGQTPWIKGKTKEEFPQLSNSGRKRGDIPWNKNKTGVYSKETLKRMSESRKGKKLTKEHIKNSLRRRPISGLEKKVLKVIKKNKLPYQFVGNGKFLIERKNPDFVNTNGEKTAVEVYCRKHKDYFKGGCDEWRKNRSKLFAKYGWKIIFIEDWQTNDENNILNLLKGSY